jgi:general stress protein CsbA
MSTHRDDAATAAGRLRLSLDKHDTDRLNLPINICIAVAFLGLGCVARMVLPWQVTKFLVGIAVISVVVGGLVAYLRRESREADTANADDTEAETTS